LAGLTIYRSSAGSGKTYTLVKEYLIIALQYPLQFSRILAITFTNKATAEMKSRIIGTLDELSSGKNPSLQDELQ
jgi:ATP-dependent helicase/nuclease subunit A